MNDIAQLASLAHSQIPQPHGLELLQEENTNGTKRKGDDIQEGSSKTKRSRYVSLACNECKRRKIKCNGQTPCQRCGNLNLDCIYAANCCNGFVNTQEYKELSAHVASLQEQVNVLYENLNNLRAQYNDAAPISQQQQQQQQQPQVQQQQYSNPSSIDPSLQTHPYAQQNAFQAISDGREQQSRPKSQAEHRQSFRGLTSADFNFGVAKSTLQTMGINANGDDIDDIAGALAAEDAAHQAAVHNARAGYQIHNNMHEDKDPLWSITKSEAERLCRMYDEDTCLMYPVVDINRVLGYVNKLFPFMEAMHRSGLMQQGLSGADAIDDDDTAVLKLVLATALTAEGSGRHELGTKLFERVQPAVDQLLLGNCDIKGIRLLVMTAVYEFQRDNEGTSWRLIGLAARLCIELGLHRRQTYDAIVDESERHETSLLFWACYVLDRRWSLGTGMPFALQDSDIDTSLPRPGDRSPYLTAMIKYSEIGSKVWRSLAAVPSAENGDISPINLEEMGYLDYQVLQWQRGVPKSLQFDRHLQNGPHTDTTASRAEFRSQVVIYLRANQMRILIHRPVLHSATSITQYREQAEKVIDIAKDSIRVLTYINQTTDLYRKQQVVFHAYLTSALAVLFLSVSHTPAFFAVSVREEYFLALDLVRGLIKGSYVSRRLWRTIRSLKEVAPKLGVRSDADVLDNTTQGAHGRLSKEDIDPSRSAAVAMAALAGNNVDEMALFNQHAVSSWNSDAGSSDNPDHMANELTNLFEAAGHYYDVAGTQNGPDQPTGYTLNTGADQMQSSTIAGEAVGENGLSNVLKELF